MKDEGTVLFAIQSYEYLKTELLKGGNLIEGTIQVEHFPDGERYQRLLTAVQGRSVILIGGTISDAATLELYDLACAIVKYGANSLMLVIPYYGYGTMERAKRPGEVVVAKTRARLLSSIPAAPLGNKVVLLDVHTEGIPHYFEGSIQPVHLYAKAIVLEAAREIGGEDFVLGSTDAGRAKWVQSLSRDLGVDGAYVMKSRSSGDSTEVVAACGNVNGRTVVLYDDMIRTGGSLLGAGRAYRDAGAKAMAVVSTHGVFCGEALERIKRSGLFTKVVTTDSHPAARAHADDFLSVRSVAPVLLSYLKDQYEIS